MTIQKFDKATLKTRQDFAKAVYLVTTDGARVEDLSKEPHPVTLEYPKRKEHGAIVKIMARDLFDYLNQFEAKQAEGFTRYNGPDGMHPELGEGYGNYNGLMMKPESAQAEDLKAINARVEAEYRLEIEKANSVVREQMIEQLATQRAEAIRIAELEAAREARAAIEAEVDAALGLK
ncbi:hypothetical protein [Pseudomonas sp.]|uniref:hypothetical protein n=1 Tax=Pseudomonas sp. TaxID=306 RepID=UPI002FC68FDD